MVGLSMKEFKWIHGRRSRAAIFDYCDSRSRLRQASSWTLGRRSAELQVRGRFKKK
jgi:hypothetical protein